MTKEELIKRIQIVEHVLNYYNKVYPRSSKCKKLLEKLNSLKKELENQTK